MHTSARKSFDLECGDLSPLSPATAISDLSDVNQPKAASSRRTPMKALRYRNQKLSIEDVPKPTADGEAVVRVTLSGICNTDLEIARGYAGFEGTLGHEFVGVVESVSEARP